MTAKPRLADSQGGSSRWAAAVRPMDGAMRLLHANLDPVTGQLMGYQHRMMADAPDLGWQQPTSCGGTLVHQEDGSVTYRSSVPVGDGYSCFYTAQPPVTAALRAI